MKVTKYHSYQVPLRFGWVL